MRGLIATAPARARTSELYTNNFRTEWSKLIENNVKINQFGKDVSVPDVESVSVAYAFDAIVAVAYAAEEVIFFLFDLFSKN